MITKENPVSLNNSNTNPSVPLPEKIGKVFACITDENTPPSNSYSANKSEYELGTIFYLIYNSSLEIKDVTDLSICQTAKPLFSFIRQYPLIGELVMLFDLPSPNSTITHIYNEKYYLPVINIWNSINHNSQANVLGKYFNSSSNVNNLFLFEGDTAFEGRFGNSIRFSSTIPLSNWSSGSTSSPITIIKNGQSASISRYVEDINIDPSSIWLTSDQVVTINAFTNNFKSFIQNSPTQISAFTGSQIAINTDRLILNSRAGSSLLTSDSHISLNARDTVNVYGNEQVILDSKKIFLGVNAGKYATEPVLLGNKTISLLNDALTEIASFASKLIAAKSTPEGTLIADITSAATTLANNLANIIPNLNNLISTTVYTK